VIQTFIQSSDERLTAVAGRDWSWGMVGRSRSWVVDGCRSCILWSRSAVSGWWSSVASLWFLDFLGGGTISRLWLLRSSVARRRRAVGRSGSMISRCGRAVGWSRSMVGRSRIVVDRSRSRSMVNRCRRAVGRSRSMVGGSRSMVGRSGSMVRGDGLTVGSRRSTVARARSAVTFLQTLWFLELKF